MYKVLVVEGNGVARNVLSRFLKREGYEVVESDHGERALELFLKERPDVVLADLALSGLNGFDFICRIKEISSQTQVIIMTGDTGPENIIKALRMGVLDFIKKPVDLDDITVALGRMKHVLDKQTGVANDSLLPTVLLADDDDIIRKYLTRHINAVKENWPVHVAHDGEEAVNVFKQEKVDIALLDVNMPRKSGLVALREMRQYSTDFKTIFLTGYADEDFVLQALRDQAVDYIIKPFLKDDIILRIENAFVKLQQDRALSCKNRAQQLAQYATGFDQT
ncbi:MAG: response regulator [Deltaproteobacteria bacterium]|nr:response regulator [Deltaproteobacteria bacterium]